MSTQLESDPPNSNSASIEKIGREFAKIPVELSTRFLEHFSEQLYSSPQKAFEELISNGWDAGADLVEVKISPDLSAANASMCVLDNGSSMDEAGLKNLWHIAFSPKQNIAHLHGRPVIGKFGIGKLATYVLANKLTYLCKSADGKIRRVTMDYGEVDHQKGATEGKLINELELSLFEVEESEIKTALCEIYGGKEILELIQNGCPCPNTPSSDDDFGSSKSVLNKPKQQTWTLVILSDLKLAGRDLKLGVLKRMLEAALPFGCEMVIRVNDELLASSKINTPTIASWDIGAALDMQELELSTSSRNDSSPEDDVDSAPKPEIIPLTVVTTGGVNAVELPGIGKVTGKIRLFEEIISGGKSDERGASNGFHVNVLGRLVNQNDPSFGEKNLSHAAWARFRMTVRADGLNKFLTTNREQFREGRELRIFRAFLRAVFNKARSEYDSDTRANLPDGGDVLVTSLGVLSLSPLKNIVTETLQGRFEKSGLFDQSGIADKEAIQKSWRENTSENIRTALQEIKYGKLSEDQLAQFRISENSIVVNKEHPFVLEHSGSKAEKELVRTVAMVNILSDIYALDIGVEPDKLKSVQSYRDKLMRIRAVQRREAGAHIARILLDTQHDSENSKRLEAAVSTALTYLGYRVLDLGKPGEPEGIASAYSLPSNRMPSAEKPHPPLYSFSFDAKSSKHKTAKTGNIDLAAVVDHRNQHSADYALVIAPGYQDGAISARCTEQKVTPITARDLGKLLEYTVEFGALPFDKLKEMFEIFSPDGVAKWVSELRNWIEQRRTLTYDTFFNALEKLEGKIPDVLHAGAIALICRENLGASTVIERDVIGIATGLSIMLPDLVGVDHDRIFVNTTAFSLRAAVATQLQKLKPQN